MADQLYLSLWYPNFRLEALPAALTGVLRQFALIGGPEARRVHAAAVFPISFSEAPTYQRLYVNDDRAEENQDTSASIIETAVAEATEQLHDDMAYEFEMKWRLWTPDSGPGSPSFDLAASPGDDAYLDTLWRPQPTTVKIIGFGPHFDDSSFEQNGHIRVDFGLDYPWILDEEDEDDQHKKDQTEDGQDEDDQDGDDQDGDDQDGDDQDDNARADPADERRAAASNLLAFHPPGAPSAEVPEAAEYIKRNVETLLAFTLSVEKNCGISSRLLWTESGEPLAEKLIARLQRLN